MIEDYNWPELYDKRDSFSFVNRYNMVVIKEKIAQLSSQHITQNSVVADLGSGTFSYEHFFNQAKLIYAVEKDKEMIEYGKHKVSNILNKLLIINDDVLNINIKANTVDVVFAIGLLDYIDVNNHHCFFTKCMETMKSGGKLIIIAHNQYNLVNLVYRFYAKLVGKKLTRVYSKQYLKQRATEFSFVNLKFVTCGSRIWLPAFFNYRLGISIFKRLDHWNFARVIFPAAIILAIFEKQ